jgi:exodeoxyribonuclease VII small subunit
MSRTEDEHGQTDADSPPLATFESSVAELESLVETLETGDISLEEALARFERGVTLARQCQTMLQQAELRVDQLLTTPDGRETVASFDPAADENAEG